MRLKTFVLIPIASLLVIAITVLLLATFVGIFSAIGPFTVLSTLYRCVIPEKMSTYELIKSSDGKQIMVNAITSRYTDQYSYTLKVNEYPAWIYESSNIPISGQTYPVTFDVVNNVPWVVLPIRGKKCSIYGFPREGFATFKLVSKVWKQVPFKEAPSSLHVNLLQSHHDNGNKVITPKERESLDARAYAANRDIQKYINEDGSGKSIKEISQLNMQLPYIADKDSCYYLNPPVDPNEKRSLTEYVETKSVNLQAKLVKESDEKIDLSEDELKQMYLVPKVRGNCNGVVKNHFTIQLAKDNQAEFSKVMETAEGNFKRLGSAEKIELNASNNEEIRSFYLPIPVASSARVTVMNCQSDRVVVDFGRDNNSLQVLEYNLNAQLLNKWSVQLPLYGHPISDISIDNNRIKIELVDFIRDEYSLGKKIPGKIVGQYSYEAELP